VPTVGHVSLVGAGPGDPGLLTRRAVARLRRADLVLYDALVDERVVRLARRAQRFYVGKRAGHAAIAQKDIHAAMIGAAQRGRRVVRLKGGDPFVFGRGGEEALALLQAGIPFDIVPGVTSAVAAPALAGIPVTHRGVSGARVVVSGHDTAAFSEMIRGLRPDALTLVVLMGRSHLPELAGILLRRDWPESQPVAVIVDASTSNQYVWRGTLKALSESNVLPDRDGATMFVVGSVAALALERADDSAVAESGTPVSPKPVHIGHRG
jgi:uroporphyrin-III C-methyltransferase/precorrin-2 dehydrogenase/sirohydrochlorin ferrochelatase